MLLQRDSKELAAFTTAAGDFPLRAACLLGDAECICHLLDSGADIDQETARGTALSTAAAQVLGCAPLVRFRAIHRCHAVTPPHMSTAGSSAGSWSNSTPIPPRRPQQTTDVYRATQTRWRCC